MLVATLGFLPLVLVAQPLKAGDRVANLPIEEDQPSSRSVTGTLLDPSGAAIAKAQVSLLGSGDKSSGDNPLAEAATDNSGSFRFDRIAPGTTRWSFMGLNLPRPEIGSGRS